MIFPFIKVENSHTKKKSFDILHKSRVDQGTYYNIFFNGHTYSKKMSEFYVTMANGVLREDFLITQDRARQVYVFTTDDAMLEFISAQICEENEFCINSRLEFLANITAYFSKEHNMSQENLEIRYKEVTFDRFNL